MAAIGVPGVPPDSARAADHLLQRRPVDGSAGQSSGRPSVVFLGFVDADYVTVSSVAELVADPAMFVNTAR